MPEDYGLAKAGKHNAFEKNRLAMENSPQTPRRRYRIPPIIQRVVTLHAPMELELYESRLETWGEIVKEEFPNYQPVNQWLIQVKEKDGVPLYDTMQPVLDITPRFSLKPAHHGFDWSLRCPCGQLTLNMHSEPGDERGYDHLRESFHRWLPQWMRHFEVKLLEKISLLYINRLDQRTIPKFTTETGALRLNEVLKVFVQIPGEHESLIPPYDCKATVLLSGRPASTLLVRVHDASEKGPAVRLVFRVDSPFQADERSSEDAFRLLNWCHDHIVRRFELVFTEEAKQSFEKIS